MVHEDGAPDDTIPAVAARSRIADFDAAISGQIDTAALIVIRNAPVERQDVAPVRRLVGIWSKFQEFDRRLIIQDERDPHPG